MEKTKEKTVKCFSRSAKESEAGDMLSFVGTVCKSKSSDITIVSSLSGKIMNAAIQFPAFLPPTRPRWCLRRHLVAKLSPQSFWKVSRSFEKSQTKFRLQQWRREKASEWKSPLTHTQSTVTLWLLSNSDTLLLYFRENDCSEVWKYLFNWENWEGWNGGCVMAETGDNFETVVRGGQDYSEEGCRKIQLRKSQTKSRSLPRRQRRHLMEMSFS